VFVCVKCDLELSHAASFESNGKSCAGLGEFSIFSNPTASVFYAEF
jgi:hypothetical protein